MHVLPRQHLDLKGFRFLLLLCLLAEFIIPVTLLNVIRICKRSLAFSLVRSTPLEGINISNLLLNVVRESPLQKQYDLAAALLECSQDKAGHFFQMIGFVLSAHCI